MPLTSGDRDTVHLFTVDLPEDQLWSFVVPDPDTGDYPLRRALGVETLDETQVEGACVEDLVGIGLTGFLTEGIGVDETSIATDRQRIDALKGSVVIVRGSAFDGADVPIAPVPPLSHFGTWHMTRAASSMEPLRSEAASGQVPPTPQPAPPPASKANRFSLMLVLAIAALVLVALGFGIFL